MPQLVKNSRGRPRNPAVRKAILKVAADLIERGGIGSVTMEAVAGLSGSGKPTIYRYWPNREALAMAALMDRGPGDTKVEPSMSALSDLRRQLTKVVETFATPRGRNALLMTASADPDSELSKAFRTQVMLASREEGCAILTRAIAEGSLRSNIRIDVALDLIYGPIFYRLLVGHAPADESFVGVLVAEALAGLAASPTPHT